MHQMLNFNILLIITNQLKSLNYFLINSTCTFHHLLANLLLNENLQTNKMTETSENVIYEFPFGWILQWEVIKFPGDDIIETYLKLLECTFTAVMLCSISVEILFLVPFIISWISNESTVVEIFFKINNFMLTSICSWLASTMIHQAYTRLIGKNKNNNFKW